MSSQIPEQSRDLIAFEMNNARTHLLETIESLSSAIPMFLAYNLGHDRELRDMLSDLAKAHNQLVQECKYLERKLDPTTEQDQL